MKVSNYKLCSSGIKEEKIQNKNRGMELRLPFREGLIMKIKRLLLLGVRKAKCKRKEF